VLVHIHPFQPRFSYDLVPSQRRTLPGSVSRSRPLSKPPSAQSPFARHSSSLFRCDLFLHIRERYFPFFAHTDSCASPCTLPSPSALASSKGLCRLSPVPVGFWTFPVLSPQIFPQVSGPLPRWVPMVLLPVSSHGNIGLLHPFSGSTFPLLSRKATSHGAWFSGLQSFLYVQTPTFARHPGRSYLPFLAAVAFTSEHLMTRYLIMPRIC